MSQTLAKENSLRIDEEERIRSVVEQCCRAQNSVLVMSPVLFVVTQGRFDQADEDSVSLQLYEDIPLRPLTLCCVSYTFEQRAHVFFANTVKSTKVDISQRLILEWPRQIALAELRSTFRVPVLPQAELAVEVAHHETRLPAVARDVSFNGVSFEVDPGAGSLNVDDVIQVSLALPGQSPVQMKGVVRNHRDHCYGVFFPGSMKNNTVDPPDDLRQLVRSLEMVWLRNRND